MAESYDGHPFQAGIDVPHRGRFPGLSIVGLSQCLVVARRAADELGNRARTAVEYELRDLETGAPYHNAIALQRKAGYRNGEDVEYEPATKNLNGDPLSSTTPARQTNGDIVLVGFLGGSREQPVILGAMSHPRADYGTKKKDGERRFLRHQDTSIEMRNDGTAILTRKDTTTQVTSDGDVRVDHREGSKIHCDADVVKLDGKASSGVLLGFEATESVIKGDLFNTLFANRLQAASSTLLAVANTLQIALQAGPPNVGMLQQALLAFVQATIFFSGDVRGAAASVESTLSGKVKTE